MTVWVDEMDDLAEFVAQLPDGTVPSLGRDDEGWYVAVDLTEAPDAGAVALPDPPPADEVAGVGGSGPQAAPAPAAGLARSILDALAQGPATAPILAERSGADLEAVVSTLRGLRDAGRVESAGVKGWKVRRRDIDHDAARARAAAAI